MARKTGLSQGDVVDAAARLADAHGLPALTLHAVARDLGVRAPSICYHVGDLDGLRRLLALRAAAGLHAAFALAVEGCEGVDALRAAARAQRAYAHHHPGLYAATSPAPRPGEDAVLYAALAAPVHVVAGLLARLGVREADAIPTIRALRAYVHGWVVLERDGGFGMPVDVDASFERGLDLLVAGIRQPAANAQERLR